MDRDDMRKATALAGALALCLPAVASAAQINVTGRPVIQRDLILAGTYWGSVPLPDGATVAPACVRVTVIVKPLVAAVGNNGVTVPAAVVWAETRVGGCTIWLSPRAWRSRYRAPVAFCVTVAHEYGHVLGIPDTPAIPLMNDQPPIGVDGLCATAARSGSARPQ